jgi:hypothetical protein
LIAADGSSLRLPNSQEIVTKFGLFKPNGTNGKMLPIARISLFVDLCTSFICSARIASEQLPEVVTTMKELNHKKLLFIYDRGYPSLAFMKQHEELQADFIFRLQRGMYSELWQRVESGETDFDIDIIAKKSNKQSHKVRIVAIQLPNGTLEVLASSLFDRSVFTLADLEKAYMLRWQIEECYKRLKIGAELENFSGINLEAVL